MRARKQKAFDGKFPGFSGKDILDKLGKSMTPKQRLEAGETIEGQVPVR
jgi:hypothetical protein